MAPTAALALCPVTAPPPTHRTSEDWLAALGGAGAERDAAVADLHALLLRAARFELGRHRGSLAGVGAVEVADLAVQSADDALMAVLRKLGSFRGESRFTTWAYKFAVLEAGVKARRRAWRDREVPMTDAHRALIADPAATPDATVDTAATLASIATAIRDVLTPHQREVLLALAVDGVPIDVLAERRETTRGALYKTLHDARRRLREAVPR
jgi:RNA polymerase sigma-70 factor, ECF subfamily